MQFPAKADRLLDEIQVIAGSLVGQGGVARLDRRDDSEVLVQQLAAGAVDAAQQVTVVEDAPPGQVEDRPASRGRRSSTIRQGKSSPNGARPKCA